jgi:hypothetical protein
MADGSPTSGFVELLTITEYAKRRGVTQPRISQLVAAKRIPTVDTPEGRRIIPAQADAAWNRTVDPSQRAKSNTKKAEGAPVSPVPADPGTKAGAPEASNTQPAPASGAPAAVSVPPGGAMGSFADARTAHERLKAKMLDVEFRRRSGELVETVKVQAAVRDAALAAAKVLDAFADRYAGPWAAESDVRGLRSKILAAVDDVKRAIATFADATADAPTETRQ